MTGIAAQRVRLCLDHHLIVTVIRRSEAIPTHQLGGIHQAGLGMTNAATESLRDSHVVFVPAKEAAGRHDIASTSQYDNFFRRIRKPPPSLQEEGSVIKNQRRKWQKERTTT